MPVEAQMLAPVGEVLTDAQIRMVLESGLAGRLTGARVLALIPDHTRTLPLPLLLPALGAAGLLVFVDALKELPATLLLRPFNFETLATHVYTFAALEQVEAGALGALAIIAAGLVPLILLHRTIASGRAGQT